MQHAQWVFDIDAPLDEFQARMRRALERRGWAMGPAQVYDFACYRSGARAYVKLSHHDRGVLVVAKVKPALLGGSDRPQRMVWEAARDAQVSFAPRPRPEAPRGGA